MVYSNILDPIHKTLDPTVWDNADSAQPTLKGRHRTWIVNSIIHVLEEAGYENVKSWLDLVLTGSLTTYQYSEDSDCDVSLFVNTDHFPEWSRAEMISVMVEHLDGKHLPGTTHPMQNFVVAPGIMPEMLYQPGLRSGYKLTSSPGWIVPPERNRVHNVEQEMNASYVYALECADKMERLLQYEPDHAIQYWHMIHRQRMRDQRAGLGDFTLSNIVYKFLAKRNLLPSIAQASGEYIAKTGAFFDDHVQPSQDRIDEFGPEWEQARLERLRLRGLPDVMYHAAPTGRRDAILGQGLMPDAERINQESNHPSGVYVWEDPEVAVKYMKQGPNMHRDMDLYAIQAPRHTLTPDPWFTENHPDRAADFPGNWYSQQAVPRENIHMFYPNVWHPHNTKKGGLHNLMTNLIYDKTIQNGGATMDLAGREPQGGFAFAPHKHTEFKVPMEQFTPQTVEDYITMHKRELEQEGNHVGTWVDGNHAYLDVSHVHPDFDEAMKRAEQAQQLAIFDLNNFQTIPLADQQMPKQGAAQNFDVDPDALEQARAHLELEHPVNVNIVGGTHGQYHGFNNGAHQIDLVGWLKPESASKQLWEEMTHAKQFERNPQDWQSELQNYWNTYGQGHDAYRAHPWELEAGQMAESHPFPLVRPADVTPNREPNEQISSSTQPEWSLS